MAQQSVAILGGGISGLSAAYYLSKYSPMTKILLVEGSKRVGGWIRSQRVSPGFHASTPSAARADIDNILFEVGPRSLRPVGAGGAAILGMANDLKLQNEMLFVRKSDPSAKNRYIYYNDEINTLPNSLSSLLLNQPPVFKSVIRSILSEPFIGIGSGQDESLYSFVSRRFNDHVALNLVGAITHGIYAGDAKQLSVKSTMRMLYDAERTNGSVIKGMLSSKPLTPILSAEQDIINELTDPDITKTTSVFGFKNGTETLSIKLKHWLQQQPNVTIITDKQVRKIEKTADDNGIKVYSDEASVTVDHVISAIPSKKLDLLLTKKNSLVNLSTNPSVNVAVVNFAFEESVDLKYNGFGFLTPHPDSSYKLPVPGILGVVFDSNAMNGQESKQNSRLVKMTVMMGGHMWDATFGNARPGELDPQFAFKKASEALNVFLGITEKPKFSMTNILEECIPQYTLGHEHRLGELHRDIKHKYSHLLSVTGASYLGVSVPDCIKNSRLLVKDLLEKGALGTREHVITGLNKIVA
ncbi:hypothetical protein [Parasitella parasitica]|uniref:Protoporphyrinogen oxidase n=1 Tax=Parasitella parasitica TaxID=35722 RepID=A0A0B7N923_9FUNG|nr:hypothetical protein [Parasitella parasitica]